MRWNGLFSVSFSVIPPKAGTWPRDPSRKNRDLGPRFLARIIAVPENKNGGRVVRARRFIFSRMPNQNLIQTPFRQ